MARRNQQELIEHRLSREVGRIDKNAPRRIALTYPSPYSVGMSSLGYQQIYRILQQIPQVSCERVFLPDGGDKPGLNTVEVSLSYESLLPLSHFPLIAISVAYELELAGLLRMLKAAGIPQRCEDRGPRDPILLAGGPLTFSNPIPLGPFIDAMILGEAEEVVAWAAEVILEASSRQSALQQLAAHPHIYVPSHHGTQLPALAIANDESLPARSVIITPDTELSSMFLIEAERGCSRTCSYCVMRRSSHGGMRKVDPQVIYDAIPDNQKKIGLVGAAVSDHPKIVEIVNTLADRGHQVGLSSLRPDRLKEPFVKALRRVGYRTLTTALDGASERLRAEVERRGRAPHYEALIEHARSSGMKRLKLYLMLGLPGETDEDIDECAQFVSQLSRRLPIALGIAPFCAKRRTPLDGQDFAGIDVVQAKLTRLRKGLRGRAEVRATSSRWAWVEYVLAQGGYDEGLAAQRAVENGGSFADYREQFADLGYTTRGPQSPRLAPPSAPPTVQRTVSSKARAQRALPLAP